MNSSPSAPAPADTPRGNAPAGRHAWLVDTTLRDGAQAPGVAFAPRDRLQIAAALADIGVDEIELGCPAMGEVERAVIRQTVALALPCRMTAWCRATPGDLDAAESCGFSAVHLAMPGSDIQLGALDKTWAWALDTLTTLVPLARRRFAFVSVGVMDASRTEPERIVELARVCDQLGADRLRLADTVGLWNPRTAAAIVVDVLSAAPQLPIGVHAHNDLGMAVANTLSALEARATSADVTVLGLGERAGNAALEELVVALRATTDLACQVTPGGLASVCDLVAACAGQPIHPRKPIVGENVFRHESGIHVRGMLRDEQAFEPFGPDAVGRYARQLDLGTHSGRAGLLAALAAEGIHPSFQVIDRLLLRVRDEAARTRQSVSPARAAAIHRQLVVDSVKASVRGACAPTCRSH